jgi:ADP-ribosylglycohydrolase
MQISTRYTGYSTEEYAERVYAGVLGKLIGVYLGRPFEGWSYEKIMAELGEITYYVHDRLNKPLIVTDDDISGTFTFLRALSDYGNAADLTPAQIGQTWLNYIVEERTILWWGGLGNSTEHTAYLRLKQGIPAPQSGSIALNGKVVAEQIGSQIFIDGWGMVSPADPARAADLARRAASVSHDGEAIYGAQVLAAMEAQAFVEHDINRLLDIGTSFIPKDSIIYRSIQDIREWHAAETDWRKTRERIVENYGYEKYGGNCHMVPNHALIIMALLYGNDDFHRSLMIVNTAGWDTDCNSGNLGCLLGIKNGLGGLTGGPDWRGPIADRLYLSTADGGRAISDAAAETYHVVNSGRALAGEAPVAPKNGARFHFELPGSVQGFQVDQPAASLENVEGHSSQGNRSLAIHYPAQTQSVHVATPTFSPPEALAFDHYMLLASPTLYPNQVIHAAISADESNAAPVTCRLFIRYYGEDDALFSIDGPEITLASGNQHEFKWRIPATNSAPIAEVGIEIVNAEQAGSVYLDYLTWDGMPNMVLTRPETPGTAWRRAWVPGVDSFGDRWPEPFRLIQNHGRGLLIQGAREWDDYRVSSTLTPHLARAIGVAARVQGMQRYYALTLSNDGQARLLKVLDGEQVLAETTLSWELGCPYTLSLQVEGTHLQAWVDQQPLFDLEDKQQPLTGGAIALLCEEGRVSTDAVTIQAL